MQTKLEDKDLDGQQHFIGVFVKDTKEGPGHASVCTVKKKAGEETEVTHTSIYPGPLGSLINGMLFGSVPVRALLASTHEQDLDESDHVLLKPVDETAYKEAQATQRLIERSTSKGHTMYSVFGKFNPVAAMTSRFFSAHKSAQQTIKNYQDHLGVQPPEDMCGIVVYPNNSHVVEPVEVHNCTSTVGEVLRVAGVDVPETLVPSFFPPRLENTGFVRVDKKEFTSRFFDSASSTAETSSNIKGSVSPSSSL
ncbi:hypothetical protein [Legionella erythra]|uniref:Uncharacterized protein n=1 Tax=Legionella erythra TaxID=448 RepID=A0A0W0TNQ2_LEGER|nr:hypothetical protein [Legionella erythra]KTC97162.1 hypothetical protein Lery_1727 [Legionella erythra]